MEKDTRLLRNPQGTEGLLLEEAYCHLKTVNQIEDLFLSWGYLPSKTPAFDYYDIYKEYLDPEVFRLFDREGELLVLRSDITLFLAKQLGMTLCEKDLPVRIFYADTILRHQGQTDISKNEYFQVGAELVGIDGMRGDAEVLAMMSDVLDQVGIETVCNIGSRDFFNRVTEKLSDGDKDKAAFWIQGREYPKVSALLSSIMSEKEAEALAQLFGFIGCREEFVIQLKAIRSILSQSMLEPLDYLLDLFAVIERLENNCSYRLDLSEIGGRSYYTGISFSVYADGADSAVASGGRYDKLLEQFGFSSPSTGFSILIRKLEQLKGCEVADSKAVKVDESDLVKALEEAARLRKNGRIVVL